jgi:rhodanese-related sulfurtransferase
MTATPPTETPVEIYNALKRAQIMLVDVREPAEYAAERIHGALLYPLSTFDPALLPQDPAKPIVLHCGSGKRSATAFARCVAAGVSVRAHMGGGMGAWKAAGLPTITLNPASGQVRDKS